MPEFPTYTNPLNLLALPDTIYSDAINELDRFLTDCDPDDAYDLNADILIECRLIAHTEHIDLLSRIAILHFYINDELHDMTLICRYIDFPDDREPEIAHLDFIADTYQTNIFNHD